MPPDSLHHVTPSPIHPRAPMNQQVFDEKYGYNRKASSLKSSLGKLVKYATPYYTPFTSFANFANFIRVLVPIVDWLPRYDVKGCLAADVIGGITVGVMHVPQGIAYAVLSKQDPIVGLYTSIFPALIYMIFGTSRHASIGSFAVVALMNGIAVERESQHFSPIEICTTLILTVGVIQLLMGLMRLEFLTSYLSDQVIAGFTTGAAIHVLFAQFKDLFGFTNVGKYSGPGYLLFKIYDLLCNIRNLNLACFGISITSMLILYIGKELINPKFKKYTNTNIPIPWELIVVVVSTVFVGITNGNEVYNIRVVNEIPTGLPVLRLPRIDIIPNILPDAISISVVTVVVHLSLSKILATKMSYKINAGQELFAISFSSIASSVFPVYPVSCALGRTMVGVDAGVATQLANFFSSILVLSVTLFFGRFLSTLPMCVLSAIVMIALKGMLKKLGDLPELWRISRMDFCIWVFSFAATVLVDVTEGLVLSVLFAISTTILRGQCPKWRILGNAKGTEDFVDVNRYCETRIIDRMRIFRFEAPLIFYNVECFKKCVQKVFIGWEDSYFNYDELSIFPLETKIPSLKRILIIDCSSILYVDLMGVNVLKEIFLELRKSESNLTIRFANLNPNMRDTLENCNFYSIVSKDHFYPTVNDAVSCIVSSE